ncbi:MAG: metalloregulator ArsR/SmtB family transcription factor [Bacilli bacterium]|nr:metalloregulator ArsR/SmtB family transcription factor [Bacilli bacterium]
MIYSYEEYAFIFKALSDKTRLEIVSMLSDKELCACKILEVFNITQPTLSYHMKMLVDTGLVNAVKDGSWVKYTINEKRKEELTLFLSSLFN